MPDTSAGEAQNPQDDPLQGLRELANSPRLLKLANTQTTIEWGRVATPPSANTSTSIVDVRELAEIVMFDATRLVAKLDEFHPQESQQRAPNSDRDKVAVPSVLKGSAVITLAFALVCVVGSHLSGTVFLHPLLAWFLIIGSIGFYFMAGVRN